MRFIGWSSFARLATVCWISLTAQASGQTVVPAEPPPAWVTEAFDPQISAYVRCVFEDREGNLWFGTNHEGVCRYDGTSLVFFGPKEGLAGAAVREIVQTPEGAMWFGTEGGLSRYHEGAFTNYTTGQGLCANDVWSMMLDKRGRLWVGTIAGVCRFDGRAFERFPIPRAEVDRPESRFNPELVWSMFEDASGNIWFGTDGEGARKFDGASFTTYTTREGLAGNQVRCITGDRQGRIWLGTGSGGASCYDGATFRNISSKDGLANDRVFAILEDSDGNLWFSTLGKGVTRYDGTAFTAFAGEGAVRTHVQSMLQDRRGTIWMGCSGGLFRFDGTTFINVTRNGPWPGA
jgi:ligand-binding sensor domain-containing protein